MNKHNKTKKQQRGISQIFERSPLVGFRYKIIKIDFLKTFSKDYCESTMMNIISNNSESINMNKKRNQTDDDISFFSRVLNKDMTGLLIPYQTDGSFDGLANWSNNYPFKVQNVEYPSVDHYIYCSLTRQEHNARLLSTSDNYVLRQRFNDISNQMFIEAIRNIASKGVENQKFFNSDVQRFLKDYPSFYFYYISNDVHLGINEHGYGYNLIGRAYSNSKSAVYSVNEANVYVIYKASVLMVHHLKETGDILKYIGMSVEKIVEELSFIYSKVIFVSSPLVFQRFEKDPYYNNIQNELDYPMNLAGFIRQSYIHEINYYIRHKFNRMMISYYFQYILKKKYNHVLDQSQLDYYVRQQIGKLNDEQYHALSNRLFEMYNDPDTNKKTHSFLTLEVREKLYDLEIQFLSKKQMVEGETYIPFLYQVRVNRSLYIYDKDSNEDNEFQPFTRYLSPIATYTRFSEYRSLCEYIYINLGKYLTQYSEDYIKKELVNCVDLASYKEKLRVIVEHYKVNLMKHGMNVKFSTNKFARYLLNDTQKYMFNIHVTDPDPIFEEYETKHLLNIRSELKDPIYSILYSLVENIYLQDRVRYRIDDFLFTYDIYRKYLNKPLLTMKDMVFLQEYIFRDPFFHGTSSKPVHPAFFIYFKDVCERPVITKLWDGMTRFASLLQKNIETLGDYDEKNVPSTSVVPVIAAMVKHFYNDEEPTNFYNFATSLLIGRRYTFKPSVTYYSLTMEEEFRKYIPINDYDALFVVNLFGICTYIQDNISVSRLNYYSMLRLKPQDTPYPSSLSIRINKHVNLDLPKTTKKKSSLKELKKKLEKKIIEQKEQEEEEQEELGEMLKDLGLEDDEEEEVEVEEVFDEDFD